jgi:hypothetical protein
MALDAYLVGSVEINEDGKSMLAIDSPHLRANCVVPILL